MTVDVLANDVSWSWWTKPRATFVPGTNGTGRTWVGSVTSTGDRAVDVFSEADKTAVRFLLRRDEADDHTNPALIVVPGKPPVAVYARHNASAFIFVRKGSENVESGPRSFGTSQQITVPSGACTYAICQHHGNTIHAWSRHASATHWCHVRSEDWGDTWGTPVAVFDGGAGSFLYSAMGHMGGADETVRVALKEHPEELGTNLYVCDVGLVSGDITLPGSATVLGNIYTGANLPILYTSLQLVKAIPTRAWIFDVSTDGAIAWAEFDDADIAGTSTYYYAERVAGAWVPRQVCGAGDKFAQNSDGAYLGGIQLAGAGVAIVSREDDGTWFIERYTTANGGSSWTRQVLASSDTDILVRAWPVDGAPGKVVYNRLTRFGIGVPEYEFDFEVFDGTIERVA